MGWWDKGVIVWVKLSGRGTDGSFSLPRAVSRRRVPSRADPLREAGSKEQANEPRYIAANRGEVPGRGPRYNPCRGDTSPDNVNEERQTTDVGVSRAD